ncbi:MAG: YCF48-related protein [Blastocatellia bacterium]
MKRSVVEKIICILIAIASSMPVARAQSRSFTIQVESAPSEAEARSSVAKLRAQGLEAYWVKAEIPGAGIRYRVRIGQYPNQAQARAKADQLLSSGAIKEFLVMVYDAPPSGSVAPGESKPATSTSKIPQRTVDKNKVPAGVRPVPVLEAAKPNTEKPAAPADAEPAWESTNLTIDNDNWKIAKHGVEIDKNLRSIYFVDSMTGWAAGDAGVVYRTTDGGRDWKPQSLGSAADISFVYFIDWNRGWMIGKSGGKMGDEAGSENILFITTNGGRAWAVRSLPNVTSLHFIDARTGWAVGRNATLLKTTDGGLEWSKVRSIEKLIGLPVESSNYNFGFSDIHFTDAQHGWLIGNFYGRARTDIGGVFMTSDGGVTWKRVPLTIKTQHDSGHFIPGSLHSTHFTDANTGSITGEMRDGEGRFFFALHTRDGGRTWSLFRIPSHATHNTQFLDPARGWTTAFAPRASGDEAAVYDTILMRTNNGGLSWRKDFTARGLRIRGLFFSSPTKGWAVGDRGMILSYEEKEKSKVN